MILKYIRPRQVGGTWAVARPEVLQDIKQLGFNMMAWANNHMSDWNIDGILTTMKHLDENKCIHAGIDRNLAEAAQPRYLDTPQGWVALIGITSTISEWGMASTQRPDVLGVIRGRMFFVIRRFIRCVRRSLKS